MGRSLSQSAVLIDELRLSVDEVKQNQPNVKSIENSVTGFRRELHSRTAEETVFRNEAGKKDRVVFDELARLGEAGEKDRGDSRAAVNEVAGMVTAVERRVKGVEGEAEQAGKSNSARLGRLDGSVGVLEEAVGGFGRDVRQLAKAAGEEQKARRTADDNLAAAVDDIRSGVSDLMDSRQAGNDRKMAGVEEQMRETLDAALRENERGRRALQDEVQSLGKMVAAEAGARSEGDNAASAGIARTAEAAKAMVAGLKEEVAARLDSARKEGNSLAVTQLRNQEDVKAHIAAMEKEVYETAGATNAKIDRTRASLEEVIRSEIQARQSTFGSLEGRVRDIVGDAMVSIENVAAESRMAVDAVAHRVNALEADLTSEMEGKITVVEEAVAARQREQARTNRELNSSIDGIHKKDREEHGERVAKEEGIVSRVVVVEERVEGEIEDVRQRVEAGRVETKAEVQGLVERVDAEAARTEEDVRALARQTNATENNLQIFNKVTADNFGLARGDISMNREGIARLGENVRDVDDKIAVNNAVAASVDLLVGNAEGEERLKDGDDMRDFVVRMMRESEAKTAEKENKREVESKRLFAEQMEEIKKAHESQAAGMARDMAEDIGRERAAGLERERAMRGELARSIDRAERERVVAVTLEGMVSRIGEEEGKERMRVEREKAEEARREGEERVRGEKEKADEIRDRLEELEVVVNEREKMEGIEWAKLLETANNGEDKGKKGEAGGPSEESEKGKGEGPKPVNKKTAKTAFPSKQAAEKV